MWCCFPQSQDPQVQDSRLGTGAVAHNVTLSEPLATVFCVCSEGAKVSVTGRTMISPSRRLTLPPGLWQVSGVGAEADYHLLCSRGLEGGGREPLG